MLDKQLIKDLLTLIRRVLFGTPPHKVKYESEHYWRSSYHRISKEYLKLKIKMEVQQ